MGPGNRPDPIYIYIYTFIHIYIYILYICLRHIDIYIYNLIIQKWQVEDWLIQSLRSAMESVSPGGDKPPRSSHVDRDTPSVGKLAHAKCALSTSIDTSKEMSFPYRPGLLCHQTSKISRLEASPSQNICFCQCTCVIWTMPTLDWEPTTKPHIECEGLGWGGSTFVVLQDLERHLWHPFAIWIYHLDFSLAIMSRRCWFFAFELVEHTCWQAYQQHLVTVSAWSRYQVQMHSPVKHDVDDLLFNSSTIPWASMPICPKDQAAAAFTWSSKELGRRLIFWDGMGWVGMYYPDSSHPQFFSWQTSPNLIIHFWVSTGMLVGNPSEGPSHFHSNSNSCPRVHWSAHPSKEEFLWTQPQQKPQTPSAQAGANLSLPRDNCQGQRFGESCYITCRAPREVSRHVQNNGHCAGFFVLDKHKKKQNHTMAIQYSLTFLVLPINKFTYWIGANHNRNNLPNLKISLNFSYQPTSKLLISAHILVTPTPSQWVWHLRSWCQAILGPIPWSCCIIGGQKCVNLSRNNLMIIHMYVYIIYIYTRVCLFCILYTFWHYYYRK